MEKVLSTLSWIEWKQLAKTVKPLLLLTKISFVPPFYGCSSFEDVPA